MNPTASALVDVAPPDPAAPLAPRLTQLQLISLFAIAVFAELIAVGWITAFLGVEQGLATYQQTAVLALVDLTMLCVLPGPLFLFYDRFPLVGPPARRYLVFRVLFAVSVGLAGGLVSHEINLAVSPMIGLTSDQIARAFPDRIGPVLWSLFTAGCGSVAYAVLRRMEDARDYARYAAALREQATEARLAALTAELRPHFLFNALNNLAELAHQDPHRTEQLLLHLASLLQESLRATDSHWVSLREELQLVDSYLALQEMRFNDRLTIERELPEPLASALVPPLILQPLVENAIVHGVEQRSDAQRLRVSAHRDGAERLVVSIEDDGPGLSAAPGPEAAADFGMCAPVCGAITAMRDGWCCTICLSAALARRFMYRAAFSDHATACGGIGGAASHDRR